MFNPGEGLDLVLEKLTAQLAVKEDTMKDIERSLQMAVDALTPLAHGANISRQSQLSLAAIALLAVSQAQGVLDELKGAVVERP